MNTQLSDRDLRQRELVPPDKLASCHVLVIGVGAVGRQAALQLAATASMCWACSPATSVATGAICAPMTSRPMMMPLFPAIAFCPRTS